MPVPSPPPLFARNSRESPSLPMIDRFVSYFFDPKNEVNQCMGAQGPKRKWTQLLYDYFKLCQYAELGVPVPSKLAKAFDRLISQIADEEHRENRHRIPLVTGRHVRK